MIIRLFLVLMVLTLSACATGPSPQFFNGNYFMAGDENCLKWGQQSQYQISCYNSAGQFTGIRNAMTVEQMQMYAYQQQEARAQRAEFDAAMDEAAGSIQQGFNSVYVPPAYQPRVAPVGSYYSGQVRCIHMDLYTNCRY